MLSFLKYLVNVTSNHDIGKENQKQLYQYMQGVNSVKIIDNNQWSSQRGDNFLILEGNCIPKSVGKYYSLIINS